MDEGGADVADRSLGELEVTEKLNSRIDSSRPSSVRSTAV
jgi:hypothetical protein